MPGWGVYCATKFAMTGFSEALKLELEPLGVKLTLVEPGYFRTDFLDGSSLDTEPTVIDDYAETAGTMRTSATEYNHNQPGDPVKGAKAIVDITEHAEPAPAPAAGYRQPGVRPRQAPGRARRAGGMARGVRLHRPRRPVANSMTTLIHAGTVHGRAIPPVASGVGGSVPACGGTGPGVAGAAGSAPEISRSSRHRVRNVGVEPVLAQPAGRNSPT